MSSVTDPRDTLVWSGVLESARERDVHLLCLDCGQDLQARTLSDLASPEALDGLVVHLDGDRRALAWRNTNSLPQVNLAHLQEGHPGIIGGNYQGMRSLLRHLVEVHGHRRIAFVQGAAGDPAADARYRAYVEVLQEYDLPRSAALVVTSKEAWDARADSHPRDLAERAARDLLDRGGAAPDAIVCCTDATALGLLETLSRRGLRVPDDIAVTGFDGTAEGPTSWPALTTVVQPWRKMGARALELLLAQLEGDPVPAQSVVPNSMVIPCELVVRESCGCWPHAVAEAGVALPAGLSWPKRRAGLLAQISEALAYEGIGDHPDHALRLVDAFTAEIEAQEGERSVFLPTLRAVLHELPPSLALNGAWQIALSLLRRHVLASPDVKGDSRARAELLIEQARVIVADTATRAQAAWASNTVRQTRATERVGTSISAHLDLDRLSAAAAQELPDLGIAGLYLCLYEGGTVSGQWCRLVAGYDADGPLDLEYGGSRFSAPQLLPAVAMAGRGRDTLLAEPLVSEGHELGYALFEVGPAEGPVCDSLRIKLSSALRSLVLLQQTERDALQLQTAAEVGRAVSSVLDPDQLMQIVVDLVLERLDLYYVGLFLVDESGSWTGEPGRWAVLRAGTGQSGRHMLADGHKLEIGGASMVGQCIAQGRARIALDVGKEAVRFDNPLLPHTRSELALPLISRERLLGAMTIQSVQSSAFGAQDIAALQLMADQMANAIETARLYSTAREALQRTQALYETSRALAATLGEASTVETVLAGLSQQVGCVYAVLFAARDDAVHCAPAGLLELLGGTWQGEQVGYPQPLGYPQPHGLPEWLRQHFSVAEGELLADVYASGTMRIVYGWDERIDRRHYEQLGVQHLVRVLAPIERRGEAVGVVEVAYDAAQAGTIDEQDTEWLAAYLDQAAVALENAQLMARLQQRLRREQTLREVSDRVRGALDVESVLQAAVTEVSRVFGCPAFIRLDGTTLSVTSPLEEGQDRGLADGQHRPVPVSWRDATDERFVPGTSPIDASTAEDKAPSTAVSKVDGARSPGREVPIVILDGVIGVLGVSGNSKEPLTVEERELLESISRQASEALQRARLLDEARDHARRERLIRDTADKMQRATDLQSLIRVAAEELVNALDATRAYVRMGVPEQLLRE